MSDPSAKYAQHQEAQRQQQQQQPANSGVSLTSQTPSVQQQQELALRNVSAGLESLDMGVFGGSGLPATDEYNDELITNEEELIAADDRFNAGGAVKNQDLRPIKRDQRIYKIEQFRKEQTPDRIRFPESSEVYIPEYNAFHREHRGQDRPLVGDMTVGVSSWKADKSNRSTRLNFRSFVDMSGNVAALGHVDQKSEAFLSRSWKMHSQVPGMEIKINGGARRYPSDTKDRPTVICHIWASNLRPNEQEGKTVFSLRTTKWSGSKLSLAQDLKDPSLNPEGQGDGGLWETRMLIKSQPAHRHNLVFEGLTPGELDRIMKTGAEEVKAVNPGGRKGAQGNKVKINFHAENSKLSQGDWAIYAINSTTHLSVYEAWPRADNALETFHKFRAWFDTCTKMVDQHGHWWFYKLEANRLGVDINDLRFPFHLLPAPRWMVTTIRADVDPLTDTIASWTGEAWSPFEPVSRHPDAESGIFAMRLGIERGRDIDIAAVNNALRVHEGKIMTQFRPMVTGQGIVIANDTYFIRMRLEVNEGSIFGDVSQPRPALNSRIMVEIVDALPGWTEHIGERFSGIIQDDIMDTDICEMAATVTRFGQGAVAVPMNIMTVFYVKVSLVEDSTTSDRQQAAMIQLLQGVERTSGADFLSAIFHSPSTIQQPGSLSSSVSLFGEASAIFSRTIDGYGLNEEQRNLAKMTFESKSGVVTLWGPPGSGKTLDLTAVIDAHVRVGKHPEVRRRKVIACAPSNAAVATLAKKFAEKSGDLEFCIFKGTKPRKSTRPDRPLSVKNDQDQSASFDLGDGSKIGDAIWEFIAFQGPSQYAPGTGDFQFEIRRRIYIDGCNSDTQAKYHGDAVVLKALRKSVRLAKGSVLNEAQKHDVESLRAQEELWTQRYLEEHCDVVFCTNSTSASEALMDWFGPDIIVSDEAALASIPDVVTPVAAHMETAQLWVVAGDHGQQGPSIVSKLANEVWKDMAKNLFETLYHDQFLTEKVMLVVQHRMKSAFSRMVSRVFYKNALVDHPSLATISPLELTIGSGLAKRLKGLWNENLRLAVSVDGKNSPSMTFGKSKSLYNPVEADLLIAHVQWLRNLEVPEGGREIRYDDILIISPYTGQVSHINQKIFGMNLGDDTGRPRVMTSSTVQGGEANIVLLSLVRNNPDRPLKLGFIGQKKQLCVNFSRVKQYQVTFGNWAPWASEELAENRAKRFDRIKQFMYVVEDHRMEKDIISEAHLRALHNPAWPIRPEDNVALQIKATPLRFSGPKRPRENVADWTPGSSAPNAPRVPNRRGNNPFFQDQKRSRTEKPEDAMEEEG